jgi:hypothetical protein
MIKEVLIEDTRYSEKEDLVEWFIVLPDGKKYILAIRGSELGQYIGVNVQFTKELVLLANEQFRGKKKKMDFRADIDVVPNSGQVNIDDLVYLENKEKEYPIAEIRKSYPQFADMSEEQLKKMFPNFVAPDEDVPETKGVNYNVPRNI